MLAPGSLLKQLSPSAATATTAVTATAGLQTKITTILICNTTSEAIKYRIYHDEAGITYAISNALYYDVTLAANSTETISFFPGSGISLAGADSLGVESNTANVVFSVYGVTQQGR